MGRHLTDQQLEQYHREGYVVLRALFHAEEMREVDRAIRELTEKALGGKTDMNKILELEPEAVDGQRVPRRIYNPCVQHRAFFDLATAPKLLDCIEELIGPNIGMHHSKLNMKPPKVGSVVDWHQDLSYFPHTNNDLVSTLVYLDDADEGNGCLQVLPRHHHHFFQHYLQDGSFAGMITEEIADGRYGRPISLDAPAGSVILMHCMTPHSSLPNRSARGRRTLIFEYRAADAYSIYNGDQSVQFEAIAMMLRGKRPHYARFGGPPQPIPHFVGFKSLYDSQEKAKATLGRTAAPQPAAAS